MDSPVEFGRSRSGSSRSAAARSASPCTTPAPTPSSTRSCSDVEKIVREEGADLRRVPGVRARRTTRFSPTTCPTPAATAWSTATARSSPRRRRSRAIAPDLLDTVAHEFFHGWNVERIRPRRSSRSTSSARTCRASSGSPKGSRSTTGRSRCSRAGLADRRATAATLGGLRCERRGRTRRARCDRPKT